jgi:hypothetical protein
MLYPVPDPDSFKTVGNVFQGPPGAGQGASQTENAVQVLSGRQLHVLQLVAVGFGAMPKRTLNVTARHVLSATRQERGQARQRSGVGPVSPGRMCRPDERMA